MEDKKKTLRDLESHKAETQELLNNLLEKLGDSLFTRIDESGREPEALWQGWSSLPREDENSLPSIWEEKQKFLKQIADSNDSIKSIESDLRRISDIEEDIKRKEHERTESGRDITRISAELGRLVISDPGYEHFTSGFEQEFNDISLKIDSQQKKLDEIDGSGKNIFNRLTNGVKGMVTKVLLSKNEAALEKFFRHVGEQFFVFLENPDSQRHPTDEKYYESEISSLTQQGVDLRKKQDLLKDEIDRLRSERKDIADTLDLKGNPARRISELENTIARTREEIKRLHRSFGESARKKDCRDFMSPYSEMEKILDDKIDSLEESINDTAQKIESTKIAIAIDNENAEIEKLKNSIEEKRKRITDAENSITEMEGQIAESQKRISELADGNGENS